MIFAKVWSAQHALLKAQLITIEVDLSNGLHAFSVVGLPDKAVAEAKDRISSAIKHCGFKSPKQRNQKVVIALAPADVRKEGPSFDVAMALGYLLASEDITFNPEKKIFLGELSLDGNVQKIQGILPQIIEAKANGFTEVYVPKENADEAALINDIEIYAVESLEQLIAHLDEKAEGDEGEQRKKIIPTPQTKIIYTTERYEVDLEDIKGQEGAKRGLEIAAAGGHNIAFFGPPGTGKTMLAKALLHLLPPLPFKEILEATSIHSIAGILKTNLVLYPPFRAPHHSTSYIAMVGGGSIPKPGEVTLAHRGILFLDEFPEFERKVIDALRQPLEDRTISISRIKGSGIFPAQFILVATMNPCPCGNAGIKNKNCTCSTAQLSHYARKISGPIIDRIDMWIEVSVVEHLKLADTTAKGEGTDIVKKRIAQARAVQLRRFTQHSLSYSTNSEISAKELNKLIILKPAVKSLLNQSAEKLDLSARSYHRIIKLARTIADLEQQEDIEIPHILEALQYRPKKNVT